MSNKESLHTEECHFKAPKDLLKKAKEKAKENGMGFSEMIRMLIRDYINKR